MKKISNVKNQLKELAKEVRDSKLFYKQKQRAFSKSEEFVESKYYGKQPTKEYFDAFYKKCQKSASFRDKHLAYSLLRGRDYLQIESKVSEGNEPHVKDVNYEIEGICIQLGLETYPTYEPHYSKDGIFTMIRAEEVPVSGKRVQEFLELKRDELAKEVGV